MSEVLTLIVAGDPDQLTGGYVYDARIVEALRQRDWQVRVIGLEGRFPEPDGIARQALDDALAGVEAVGALRPLATCLSDMGANRRADWGQMRPHVLSYLCPESHATLLRAERAGPYFDEFFDGFARARG